MVLFGVVCVVCMCARVCVSAVAVGVVWWAGLCVVGVFVLVCLVALSLLLVVCVTYEFCFLNLTCCVCLCVVLFRFACV